MNSKKTETHLASYAEAIATLVADLRKIGFEPVLIGGMALILLGSERMTFDFDFVIAKREDWKTLLDSFYDNGFELVSKLAAQGQVAATIDNRRVAAIRLELDKPTSFYFFNSDIKLRIDILLDFPILAKELIANARKIKIASQPVLMASVKDLLRLKKIAKANRNKPGDAEDILFLKSLGKKNKK